MGLLSDPVNKQKLLGALEKWKRPISILGYLGGLVWLVLLANEQFNARTYMSENALLPAMVETRYLEEHAAYRAYNQLGEVCNKDTKIQRNWIANQMMLAGLEVFQQNFSCGNGKLRGQNIYGILRSPRSSGVESLVLNVPNRQSCQSTGALALMTSIVEHFKLQSYWAKDIVFLVTEEGSCGIAAWLEAYHGEQSNGIIRSDLQGHAGKIQAALVIDFPDDNVNGFDVVIEGINGLLPNLDLINMAFAVSGSEAIIVKLHTQDMYHGYTDKFQDHLRCLKTLTKMILLQATGFPMGEHGLFFKYRIEAVTLKAAKEPEHGQQSRFQEIGKVVEGIFRSFNSLQEHFHQSFFMYLLPASDRYISIALYMPILGGILLGPLLYAITLWMETFGLDLEHERQSKESNLMLSWNAKVVIVGSHAAGVIVYYALPILLKDKTDALFDGGITFALVLSIFMTTTTVRPQLIYSHFRTVKFFCFCALPFYYTALLLQNHRYGRNQEIYSVPSFMKPLEDRAEWKIFKLFTIFYLTGVVATSSLLNFSFALMVAVPLVPVLLLAESESSWLRRIISNIVIFIASPITFLVLLSALNTAISDERTKDVWSILCENFKVTDSMIRYAIENAHLGVWTWKVISLVVFPIWILITVVACPLS